MQSHLWKHVVAEAGQNILLLEWCLLNVDGCLCKRFYSDARATFQLVLLEALTTIWESAAFPTMLVKVVTWDLNDATAKTWRAAPVYMGINPD
jgi:hypothetical protein